MDGRLKAGLFLGAMFGLGVASGIAWQNYRIHRPGLHHYFVAQRVKWLKRQLHLSPLQEEEFNQIIEDAQDRMAEIHQDVAPDLAEIHQDSLDYFRYFMTPEQRKKFDELRGQSHAPQVQRDMPSQDRSPLPLDTKYEETAETS